MNRNIFRLIFLLTLAAGTAYFFYNRYRIAPEIVFSNIEASTLNGDIVSFKADGDSKTIILYFATWCIDCRRELPVIQSYAELLKELNIKVYLISDEEASILEAFQRKIEEPIQLLKLKGKFKDSGIYTLPTAVLYCSNGKIHFKKTGAINWTEDLLRSFHMACN